MLVLLLCSFADDADAQLFRRWSKFKGRRHAKTFKRAKVGFGLPYGGFFGINTEVGAKYVALNAGLGWFPARGYTSMSTAGWSIGLRGYAMKPDKTIRFRTDINYGVNGVYYDENGFNVASGVSVAFGMEHRFADSFLYNMDLSIPLRGTNSYRPSAENRDLEFGAFPSIGIGMAF